LAPPVLCPGGMVHAVLLLVVVIAVLHVLILVTTE
jgi:hypothetical protein